GELLAEGGLLRQPGLVLALELLRDEGAVSVYRGTIARSLLDLMRERGGAISAADLEGYRPLWTEPTALEFAGRRVLTRRGLSGMPETLARFDPAAGAPALLAALEAAPVPDGHTTNLSVVDA